MFDDIRPYYDYEIPDAMKRISDHPLFPALASFVYPESGCREIRDMLRGIGSIRDFQLKVMYQVNQQIIKRSITEFTYDGLQNIDSKTKYTFVSNHRDIMLDASLLQLAMVENGHDTAEITFGANLMQDPLVVDIGKSNKMFRVERPGKSMREFLKASKYLSDYIHYAITEKNQSVWIAQRNGRTKNGTDRTDQGVINMLRLGSPDDMVASLAELNITPVAVSYEWEPCDVLKALELYARQSGPYTKQPGEDLNSILTGILQPKGRVHFSVCKPLTKEELYGCTGLRSNEFNKHAAGLIDRRICRAYRLWPNNYIAHDIMSGTRTYSDHYTKFEEEAFLERMNRSLENHTDKASAIRSIFLGIYAYPVDSANLFLKADEMDS